MIVYMGTFAITVTITITDGIYTQLAIIIILLPRAHAQGVCALQSSCCTYFGLLLVAQLTTMKLRQESHGKFALA